MSADTVHPPDEGGKSADATVVMMTRAELAALIDERLAAQPPRPHRHLYHPERAAEAFGVSERKVYQLLAAGMPCVYVGCQRRIDLDQAIAWLEEHGEAVGR